MSKVGIINKVLIGFILLPLCAFANITPNHSYLSLQFDKQGKNQGWKMNPNTEQTWVSECPTTPSVYSRSAGDCYGQYGKISRCGSSYYSKSRSMHYITNLNLINKKQQICKVQITVKCYHSPCTRHVRSCWIAAVGLDGFCENLENYSTSTKKTNTASLQLLFNVLANKARS